MFLVDSRIQNFSAFSAINILENNNILGFLSNQTMERQQKQTKSFVQMSVPDWYWTHKSQKEGLQQEAVSWHHEQQRGNGQAFHQE